MGPTRPTSTCAPTAASVSVCFVCSRSIRSWSTRQPQKHAPSALPPKTARSGSTRHSHSSYTSKECTTKSSHVQSATGGTPPSTSWRTTTESNISRTCSSDALNATNDSAVVRTPNIISSRSTRKTWKGRSTRSSSTETRDCSKILPSQIPTIQQLKSSVRRSSRTGRRSNTSRPRWWSSLNCLSSLNLNRSSQFSLSKSSCPLQHTTYHHRPRLITKS